MVHPLQAFSVRFTCLLACFWRFVWVVSVVLALLVCSETTSAVVVRVIHCRQIRHVPVCDGHITPEEWSLTRSISYIGFSSHKEQTYVYLPMLPLPTPHGSEVFRGWLVHRQRRLTPYVLRKWHAPRWVYIEHGPEST